MTSAIAEVHGVTPEEAEQLFNSGPGIQKIAIRLDIQKRYNKNNKKTRLSVRHFRFTLNASVIIHLQHIFQVILVVQALSFSKFYTVFTGIYPHCGETLFHC